MPMPGAEAADSASAELKLELGLEFVMQRHCRANGPALAVAMRGRR